MSTMYRMLEAQRSQTIRLITPRRNTRLEEVRTAHYSSTAVLRNCGLRKTPTWIFPMYTIAANSYPLLENLYILERLVLSRLALPLLSINTRSDTSELQSQSNLVCPLLL